MINWLERPVPLAPSAVVARGEVRSALFARLIALDEARFSRLRGVSAEGLWIIAGEAEDLPWVEGLLHLGREPSAPALLLPTYLRTEPSAALVARKIARTARGPSPWALFGEPARLVSLAAARALDRGALEEALHT